MNEGGLPVVFFWVGDSRNLGYENGGYGEAFLGGLPGGHGVFYRRGKAVRTGKKKSGPVLCATTQHSAAAIRRSSAAEAGLVASLRKLKAWTLQQHGSRGQGSSLAEAGDRLGSFFTQAKQGCYKPTPLRLNLVPEIQLHY